MKGAIHSAILFILMLIVYFQFDRPSMKPFSQKGVTKKVELETSQECRLYDKGFRFQNQWIPWGQYCNSSSQNLNILNELMSPNATNSTNSWFHNKTFFLLGNGLDDQLVTWMCRMLSGNLYFGHDRIQNHWQGCSSSDFCSRICFVPDSNTLLMTGFQPGISPDDSLRPLFNSSSVSRQVLKPRERIHAIFKPYFEWYERLPDYILYSTSLWDLIQLNREQSKDHLFMGSQDILSPVKMKQISESIVNFTQDLQSAFPNATLFWRNHPLVEPEHVPWPLSDIQKEGNDSQGSVFSHYLDQTLDMISKEALQGIKIPFLDWKRITPYELNWSNLLNLELNENALRHFLDRWFYEIKSHLN